MEFAYTVGQLGQITYTVPLSSRYLLTLSSQLNHSSECQSMFGRIELQHEDPGSVII